MRFYNADNESDDVDVKLPMHLSDRTYVSYSKASRVLGVKSIPGSTFSLYDRDDRLVTSGLISGEASIPVSSYPAGTYTLEISGGKQSIRVRVIF